MPRLRAAQAVLALAGLGIASYLTGWRSSESRTRSSPPDGSRAPTDELA
jgi:hypothetical protein